MIEREQTRTFAAKTLGFARFLEGCAQQRRAHNGLVAGSSPAGPAKPLVNWWHILPPHQKFLFCPEGLPLTDLTSESDPRSPYRSLAALVSVRLNCTPSVRGRGRSRR